MGKILIFLLKVRATPHDDKVCYIIGVPTEQINIGIISNNNMIKVLKVAKCLVINNIK